MKYFLIFTFTLCLTITASAQILDSLQVQAGTSVTVASKDFLPLWLVSNRYGIITDQQFDFSTHLRATNTNQILPWLKLDYGIDIYNNDHLRKTIIQEAFLKARYKKLQFSAGRFKQVIGEVDPDLSSGSLGLSGNSLPIPEIKLSLDYTDIPFTNGWIQFKGQIGHGWMGDHQFMKSAYLHEKNIYFRLGKRKLKLYGGLQHYAVWGGSRSDFLKLDKTWGGFWNVFLAKESDDGSTTGQIRPNRSGDQRGVIEAGAEWENDDYKINLNNQTPFDMGQGIDIRNIDRLLSLNITNKKPGAKLKKLVLEFIYTKQMNDFYALQYRENYYNNGIYRTGWEYNDQIIGTPLFLNRVRGSKYFDDVKPYDWDAPQREIGGLSNIINNRVVGGHVAFVYEINKAFSTKTKLTYTKNYGKYGPEHFETPVSQAYTMEEVSWRVPNSQLSLSGTIAYDFGKLYNNFGSMIGLQWQLRN